jgi:uncharacterized membrane protein
MKKRTISLGIILVLLSISGAALDVAVSVDSPPRTYSSEVLNLIVRTFNIGPVSITGDVSIQIEDVSTQANIKFVNLAPGAEQSDTIELIIDPDVLPGNYMIQTRIISLNESVSQEQSILITTPPLFVELALLKKVFEVGEENAAVVTLTSLANTTITNIRADLKLAEKLEYMDTGFSLDELRPGKDLEKTLKFESKTTARGTSTVGIEVTFKYDERTHTLLIQEEVDIRTRSDILNIVIILLIVAAALAITREKTKGEKPFKDLGKLLEGMQHGGGPPKKKKS